MRIFAIILLLTSLGLVGCTRSPQSNFYVLSSRNSNVETTQSKLLHHKFVVGIGPVIIPEHLDRPQIITRTTDNLLHLAEYNRWAESLEKNFSRILMEDLSPALSRYKIAVVPWKRSITLHYQVVVEIDRFDGVVGERAVLKARWRIVNVKEKQKLLVIKRSSYVEPVTDDSYEALVSAMSKMVNALSHDIAKSIKKHVG